MREKVLLVWLIIMMFAVTVSAEQSNAEKYRQIFQSGTYYIEYSTLPYEAMKIQEKIQGAGKTMGLIPVYDRGTPNDYMHYVLAGENTIHSLASDRDKRLKCVMYQKKGKHEGGFFGGIIPIIGDILGTDTQVKITEKRPEAMYKDGKYYRFPNVDTCKFIDDGDIKGGQTAKVLPENLLFVGGLDPTEGWQYIRMDLALPDEFAVFNWNDVYRDKEENKTTRPIFSESRKVVVDKSEYDCDRYVAEVKTAGGEIISQEAYDMLYNNEGNLALINRYAVDNGKETLIGKVIVRKIMGELPVDAFTFKRQVKVYAAGMGDADDFLGTERQVETLGGE